MQQSSLASWGPTDNDRNHIFLKVSASCDNRLARVAQPAVLVIEVPIFQAACTSAKSCGLKSLKTISRCTRHSSHILAAACDENPA